MQAMVQQAQGDMTDDQLQAANPLAMLLRTLLPWVNVGQELGPVEEGGGGAGGDEGGGGGWGPQQEQQQQDGEGE